MYYFTNLKLSLNNASAGPKLFRLVSVYCSTLATASGHVVGMIFFFFFRGGGGGGFMQNTIIMRNLVL